MYKTSVLSLNKLTGVWYLACANKYICATGAASINEYT